MRLLTLCFATILGTDAIGGFAQLASHGGQNCGIGSLRYRMRCLRASENSAKATEGNPQNGDKFLGIERNGKRHNIAVFSKCMNHNEYGEVPVDDMAGLRRSLSSGMKNDYDKIRLDSKAVRKLANPQAALATSYIGSDSYSVPMKPAPRFQSPTTASDMIYVYGQALLRDVPFYAINYGLSTVEHLVDDLLYDLNKDPERHYGAKNPIGVVDRSTLFRGPCSGCLHGPVVSQFLLHGFSYGGLSVESLVPVMPDKAFSVSYDGWLDIQKGRVGPAPVDKSSKSRICNWRTLGAYVYNDPPCSAFYNAALLLLDYGAPLDPNIRLGLGKKEAGFLTLGITDIISNVLGACYNAGKGAWRHKWDINMRLRPEAMAGRVHFSLVGKTEYGIHPLLLQSRTVKNMRRYNKENLGYDTYFLPMMYQEGSPTHPSYPAGHSTFAGAGATILKAFFDDSVVLSSMVDSSGKALKIIESISCAESEKELYESPVTDPIVNERLTVGGEIDKMAWNIGLARCAAGVHYPTDSEGIYLGEKMAIRYLEDLVQTYNEDVGGFTFRRFNGKVISILKKQKAPNPSKPTFVKPH